VLFSRQAVANAPFRCLAGRLGTLTEIVVSLWGLIRLVVAPVLQWLIMSRTITQRELRNESGEIMRQLDEGETFVVTRRGVPVGELVPIRRRRFATRGEIAAAFGGAPPIDLDQLRSDLDRLVDQDITPRG